MSNRSLERPTTSDASLWTRRSQSQASQSAFLRILLLEYPQGITPSYPLTTACVCVNARTFSKFIQSATSSGLYSLFKIQMFVYLLYRPSTPIFELLNHKYQTKWLQEARETERRYRQTDTEKKKMFGNIRETKASMLSKYAEPVEPGPYWKMKRFRNVG